MSQLDRPNDFSARSTVLPPSVIGELLALMDTVGALAGNGSPAYRDGYDRAIGEVRELLADRLDELGVKVEQL